MVWTPPSDAVAQQNPAKTANITGWSPPTDAIPLSAPPVDALRAEMQISPEEDLARKMMAIETIEEERRRFLSQGRYDLVAINDRELALLRSSIGNFQPQPTSVVAPVQATWTPPADAFVASQKKKEEEPKAPMVTGPTPGLVSFINEPKKTEPKKVFTGSVFDTQPFNPEISPEEAVRLSRRAYAEETTRLPRRIQEMRATPEDQINRSILRAAGDTAIGVLQGAAAIPKGITDNIPFDNPLSQFYKDAYEAGERSKSGYLRSKNVERAALLENIRKNQGELAATRGAFTTMFSPAGADIVAQGAGSMVPALGMSVLNLGTKSMMAMNALANAGDSAQQTAAKLADMSPEDWSKSSAYQTLREQGMDHRDAVRMLAPIYALPSQTIGGIVGAVSGGTGLESALVKGAARSARARAGRAGVELLGEEAETLAPMLAGNLTQRIIDDKTALLEGIGQAAVETAAAAGPGSGLAAAIATPEAKIQPNAEQMARSRGFLATAPSIEPLAETVPSTPESPATPASIDKIQQSLRELEQLAGVAKEQFPVETTPTNYESLLKERLRLESKKQTPEVKARLAEVNQSAADILKRDVEAKRKDAEAAKTSVFGQEELPPVQSRELMGLQAKPGSPELTDFELQQAKETAAMAGEPSPESQEALAQQKEKQKELKSLQAERNKIKTGGNLYKMLEGQLDSSEVSDIAPDIKKLYGKGYKPLVHPSGQGTFISELVENGVLNHFLPIAMRPDSSSFDSQTSTEYIKNKLREKDTSSYASEDQKQKLDAQIAEAQRALDELGRPEAEIAKATAEERAARAETIGKPVTSEVEALRQQARDKGIDTSPIEERAYEEARDNPSVSPDTILAERLSEAMGMPRYQRSTSVGKPMPKAQTESVVNSVASQWKNAPEMVVAQNMDDPVIPAEVREHNKAAMSKGAKGAPKGFFYKGKAYVIADSMTSIKDVVETMFHESLGHYGLRGTFGPEMTKVLEIIIKAKRAEVEAKAKKYGLDINKHEDMLEAAEEVLAVMAQTRPELPFVKRAIAVIRNFLRKLGLPIRMTDADIVEKYILPARAFVEKGERRAVEGRPAAMRENRVPQTINVDGKDRPTTNSNGQPIHPTEEGLRNFWRWFGDSKVVDAEGRPLVVYHGTMNDFNVFDPNKSAEPSMPGIGATFVTDNPEFAAGFTRGRQSGGNIMPVYVRAKNPFDFDNAEHRAEVIDDVIDRTPIFATAPDRESMRKVVDESIEGRGGVNNWLTIENETFLSVLKDRGFDSFYVRENGQKNLGLFDPTQIKSATGNIGAFDPNNPDIRYQRTAAPENPAGVSKQGEPTPMSKKLETKVEEIPKEKKLEDTWLFGRDKSGRVGFGPGAKAYAVVSHVAGNVLDKLSMKPISPELNRAMRNMKNHINQVQNKIGEVAVELQKLSPAEREMISDIIEGELKANVYPPQHVLNIAAAMQSMMSRQSQELVDLGMLSKEAAQRWDKKYLPRFYESKLKDEVNAWAKATREVFRKQPVMRGIKGANLRSRGIFEAINTDDLQSYIDQGWEQRDPSFDPATSKETVVWRDYSKEEREKMGEIRDAMFRFVMGYNSSQRDVALGRLYKNLSENYASKVPLDGYVKVPDTKAEGTNAFKYGELAGLYVPKEVMDHLSANDMAMANGVVKIYRAGLSKWKEGKTVLNPVSHGNNIISNLTMAHFAGVSYWDAHKYAGAVKDFVTKNPMVQEAKDVGLFGGTFNQSELVKAMPPQLREMAGLTESKLANYGEKLWDTLAFTVEYKGKKYGARPVMQWAYENEDMFFRYLIYRDARSRGLSPEDARDYSQEYIFTYDDLPKGARALRDYAMPFFSYTYKVLPVLMRTALVYPWRYAAPATAAYTANAMMYAMAASLGGGEDDWWGDVIYKYVTDEEFRKRAKELESGQRRRLPEWLKGESAILSTPKAIFMGMDAATNLPLFLDISRIFPGGDLLDANNNTGGAAIFQPLVPSNPLISSFVAIYGNLDLYRGKEVVSKSTDTPEEQSAKRFAWMWDQITPAISVGNYNFDRAMGAIAQMTGKPIVIDAGPMGTVSYTGVGKDGLAVQPKHAMLQTMGIKIRPYDLEVSDRISASDKRKVVRELDSKIKLINRQENKGIIASEVAKIEREKLITKRRNIKQGLTLSGEEKD